MTIELFDLDSHLGIYYRSLYPIDLICKWLTYNKDVNDYFAKREFVFILKDDIHLRYLSFKNSYEFKNALSGKIPYKIDLGAVYNYPPRDRQKYNDFHTKERELVFDIDLTDYDGIRTCCSGTNVCEKCWRFIVIAVEVLENLMRNNFGFKHLLWVFSGRRGIHCWVADERARKLTNYAREAISKHVRFDKLGLLINKNRVHPTAESSYRVIMNSNEIDKLVIEQGWLESEEKWTKILKHCYDESMREILKSEFKNLNTVELRWRLLKLRFDETERSKAKKNGLDLPNLPKDSARNFLKIFVLTYVYPKIDDKVTATLNHLLKSPFSVHPKTGHIAVPLNLKTIHKFDLNKIPRVDKLANQVRKLLAETDPSQKKELQRKLYNKTDLAPYIAFFIKFLTEL